MDTPLRGWRAIQVFLCFALGYLLSYAMRAINAVIAPALTSELQLSSADLGLLSSAYFVSFGCMQLPLGVWLDKYGPRRTEAALLLVAAAGAVLFATSTTLTGLWCGRALIGVGVSACLMASLKAYRQWYPYAQQSQLNSWMLVAGTSGALSATVPVALALPLIGWRGVFWIVAALLLAVAAAIFVFLRKVERSFAAAAPAPSTQGGYGLVFGSAYFWRMGVPGLIIHGTFFALHTLWAGPWMTTVLGKTPQQTSEILFAFNVVLMLAYLALGWAAPRMLARGWDPHRLIGCGLAAMLLAEGAMLLTSAPEAWLLWLLLALFVPATTLLQSHAGLAFPAHLAGRANAAYNLQIFIGAFVAQWGIGLVIDAFKGAGAMPADAFRSTLAIALVLQLAALLFFVLNRARPGQGTAKEPA